MTSIYDKLSKERKELQEKDLAPSHWSTGAYQLFKEKYQYQADNPREQYVRIARTLAAHTKEPGKYQDIFFDLMWKGWLSPSTPVLANTGTTRGLPVSCAGDYVGDDLSEIYKAKHETAMLTKMGFGTASYLGDIRPRGSNIGTGGKSSGVLPIIKGFHGDMDYVVQGCYKEGTEVLTSKGFVDFKEITNESLIAQLDEKRNVTFTKGEPTVREWDGLMYRFHSSVGMDLNVTPNHRMMVERVSNKYIDGVRHKKWKGYLEEIQAQNVKYHRDVQHHVSGFGNNQSLSDAERFRIAYQADGQKYDVRSNNDEFTVRFNFQKERKISRFKNLLDRMSLPYEMRNNKETTTFLVKITQELYHPDFSWVDVGDINGRKGVDFLLEVAEWDSHWENEKSFTYCSTDPLNVDKVQAVASVSGMRTSRYVDRNREGNRKDLHRVYVRTNYQPVQGESIRTSMYHYVGKVYCCVVPKGRIIVRDQAGFVSVCGNTARRGSWAGYLPIDHGDFDEVNEYLRHHPDGNNIGWNISKDFLEKLSSGDKEANRRYGEVMKTKMITGKGYFWFNDKVNDLNPQWYKDQGLNVKSSQLCSEIALHSDEEHTFTCVLASMNLMFYNEWKDTDAVFNATIFLDAVCQEFIERAKNIEGLEKAVRFTKKSRALGLGVCGFHTYLQQEGMPFGDLRSHLKNIEIFKLLDEESKKASKYLAETWGEPEWMKGYGYASTHRIAIAPTKSTALLMGGVSEGINPDTAMVYTQRTPAGEVDRVNPVLLKLMKERGVYNKQTLQRIRVDNFGSVQNEDWLTDEEKEVFKIAFEINMHDVIRLASTRSKYIDQWQSLNLFFAGDADPGYINSVHQEAFLDPMIKGLYYVYSRAGVQASIDKDECTACQ